MCFIFYFFFFKQKTAYEMRISDWSSDVCSSDLVFYLLGVQYTSPANAQLLIQLAPLLMALGGIVVFRERFNAWQWLGLAVIVIGLSQIGRASCRERVCQDV